MRTCRMPSLKPKSPTELPRTSKLDSINNLSRENPTTRTRTTKTGPKPITSKNLHSPLDCHQNFHNNGDSQEAGNRATGASRAAKHTKKDELRRKPQNPKTTLPTAYSEFQLGLGFCWQCWHSHLQCERDLLEAPLWSSLNFDS